MKTVLIPILVLHLNLKPSLPTVMLQQLPQERSGVPRSAQLWANPQQKRLLRAEGTAALLCLLPVAAMVTEAIAVNRLQERNAKASSPALIPNLAVARHPNLSALWPEEALH